MVMVTLNPKLARLIIADREGRGNRNIERYQSLEEAIQKGGWDRIPPIWITPNLIVNGLFCSVGSLECGNLEWHSTLKPFIMYNGHHRLDKALEHGLPVRAYVRFTPRNPIMPKEERLQYCDIS